jgi:hypothetical protein
MRSRATAAKVRAASIDADELSMSGNPADRKAMRFGLQLFLESRPRRKLKRGRPSSEGPIGARHKPPVKMPRMTAQAGAGCSPPPRTDELAVAAQGETDAS